MIALYRVQDDEGRGPWRPGHSSKWVDMNAPVNERDRENLFQIMSVDAIRAADDHCGCACRSMEELMAWFSRAERERLKALKFYPVRMLADRILAEGQYQVMFSRKRPLNQGATRLSWK